MMNLLYSTVPPPSLQCMPGPLKRFHLYYYYCCCCCYCYCYDEMLKFHTHICDEEVL